MEFRRPYPNSGVKIPENGFDYIVYQDGDNVVAKNGGTGEIEFEGTDVGEVITNIPDNSSIAIKSGYYKYSTPITLSGKNTLGQKSLIGFGRVQLEYTGNDRAIIIDGTSKAQRGIVISNIELYVGNGATGIWVEATAPSYVSQVRLDNVYIMSRNYLSNRYKYGIYFNGTNNGGEVNMVVLNNIQTIGYEDGGYGVYARGVTEFMINNYASNPYLSSGFTNNTYSLYYIGGNLSANQVFVDAPVFLSGNTITINTITFEGNFASTDAGDALQIYGNNITINSLRASNLTAYKLINIGSYSSNIKISDIYSAGTNNIKYLFGFGTDIKDVIIENMSIPSSQYTYLSGAVFPDGIRFIGGLMQRSGVVTFTGDGTTTTFSVAHGLVMYPASISTTPRVYYMVALDENAKGYSTFSADSTYLYVTFPTALPSGSTATFYWYAEV